MHFLKIIFLLYMKGGLPLPIHLMWHQPHSIPPEDFVYSFSVIFMNIFFFSRFYIITKQKELCEKIKKSKIGK